MKKDFWDILLKILTSLCIVLIGLWIVLFVMGITNTKEYPKTTVVKELDYENDAVICVDFNGHDWSFYGIEDWMVGDYCSMIINDHGTPLINDDTIVDYQYSGWLEGGFGRTAEGDYVIEMW